MSVVIPAMNEARNLAMVLPQLPDVEEVVLVDGGSVDATVDVARRLIPEVRILQQTRRGKGNALAVGFGAVTGDVVVMLDADGSADPAEIPAFRRALVEGADFAKGSRFAPGGGSSDLTQLRRSGNAGLCWLANRLFGTHYTDLCYGYNAFWTDILDVLALPDPDLPPPADGSMIWGDGFEVETMLNCRVAAAGLRVTEVPSLERERIYGETHLDAFADGLRVLRTLLAEHAHALEQRKEGRRLVGATSIPSTARGQPLAGA